MKQKSIASRAASFARGKRIAGSVSSSSALAEGWEAGYRAALRDVSQVGAGLSIEISHELGRVFADIVKRATDSFNEELRKIGECAES